MSEQSYTSTKLTLAYKNVCAPWAWTIKKKKKKKYVCVVCVYMYGL